MLSYFNKTFLANGLRTIFINVKPFFSNGCRGLSRKSPDCTILDSLIFDSFVADKLFAKVLRSFENCLSVSTYSCEKLVSSLVSPIKFDERFRVTNKLGLDNFT